MGRLPEGQVKPQLAGDFLNHGMILKITPQIEGLDSRLQRQIAQEAVPVRLLLVEHLYPQYFPERRRSSMKPWLDWSGDAVEEGAFLHRYRDRKMLQQARPGIAMGGSIPRRINRDVHLGAISFGVIPEGGILEQLVS